MIYWLFWQSFNSFCKKSYSWATYSSIWRLDLNLRIIMDRVHLPMSHCFVLMASLQTSAVWPFWPQDRISFGSSRRLESSSWASGCDIALGGRILQKPELNFRSKIFSIRNRTGVWNAREVPYEVKLLSFAQRAWQLIKGERGFH